MRHSIVTIYNIYRNARVAPTIKFPKLLLKGLTKRGASYGIINISKIKIYDKRTVIEVSWYDEYNTFLCKLWSSITQDHLIHLSDGYFNIDETLEDLDKIADNLMETKVDTYV